MRMTKKHPSSVVTLTFDFSRQMGTAETISAISSVTASPSGDLTFAGNVISGQTVTTRVSGGGSAKIYTVTCVVTTSGTQTLYAQQGVSVNDPSDYP